MNTLKHSAGVFIASLGIGTLLYYILFDPCLAVAMASIFIGIVIVNWALYSIRK